MKDLIRKYEEANKHLTKWAKVRKIGFITTVSFLLGF